MLLRLLAGDLASAYIDVVVFRTALLSACMPFDGVHEIEHQNRRGSSLQLDRGSHWHPVHVDNLR